MKRLMLVAVVGAVAMALASGAQAGVPWAGGTATAAATPAAPAAGEAAAPGDLKTELSQADYKSLVKPIEDKVALAEKAMENYNKTKEKLGDKAKPGELNNIKEAAINMYLGASLAAKQAAGRTKKDTVKAALAEQFEKPNKQKAVDMMMEMATEALAKMPKDFKLAAGLYKKVVAVDPQNEAVKEAMKQLEADYTEAMKTQAKVGAKGGSGDDVQKPYGADSATGKPAGGWGSSKPSGGYGGNTRGY